MEQACLVTGKSSELLGEVVQEAAVRNRPTLVARSGPLDVGSDNENVATISWNRRSALSARSVVLHAQNAYARLDEAVIVFSPVRESVPFHESSIVSIENRTDAEVKGYLFLIREIVGLFQKQRSGKLLLAVLEPESEIRSPLEAMSLGSFTSAAEALRSYYQNEAMEIKLCSSRSNDASGYASFLMDTLDAPRPRRPRADWLRYGGRGGFFSRPR
jgi:hypothetical protein